jgi:hypothetical protein
MSYVTSGSVSDWVPSSGKTHPSPVQTTVGAKGADPQSRRVRDVFGPPLISAERMSWVKVRPPVVPYIRKSLSWRISTAVPESAQCMLHGWKLLSIITRTWLRPQPRKAAQRISGQDVRWSFNEDALPVWTRRGCPRRWKLGSAQRFTRSLGTVRRIVVSKSECLQPVSLSQMPGAIICALVPATGSKGATLTHHDSFATGATCTETTFT